MYYRIYYFSMFFIFFTSKLLVFILFVNFFPYFIRVWGLFYKHFVIFTNNLQTFEFLSTFFLVLSNLANPYFMGYLPQHCLYFLPLPHGTDGEWSFSQRILLISFIYGLFLTSRFLIFPLDFSVYWSKNWSKMPNFPI